jgi:hypothetical protein
MLIRSRCDSGRWEFQRGVFVWGISTFGFCIGNLSLIHPRKWHELFVCAQIASEKYAEVWRMPFKLSEKMELCPCRNNEFL